MTPTDKHQKLKDWLYESWELTRKYKEEGRTHRDYYRGRQLSDKVLAILKERGQPEMWENLYQMIGNKVVGYKIDTRTQAKVIGRQYEDRPKAEVVTDMLRAFTDSSSTDGIEYYTQKRKCDEDLMLYGLCAMEPRVRLTGEKDKRGKPLKEVEFVRVDPDELWCDPYSKRLDYSDARYLTRSFWIDKDSLYGQYDKETVDRLSTSSSYIYDTRGMNYVELENLTSHTRPRVCVNYTWYKEYDEAERRWTVRYAVWTQDMLLEDTKSPYKYSRIPVSVRRLFDGEQGEWFGMFRNLRPLQDSINYASIRLANMLGSSKLLVEETAVDDAESFKTDYSKDNAVVVVNDRAIREGKIKEISQADRIAQLQMRINDLKQTAKTVAGFNEEALGVAVNRLSGYAIEQRQRTGLMGMMHYIDCSASFDRDVFGTAVELIKQYFTAEQTFYIVDQAMGEKMVEIGGGKNSIDISRYDISVEFVPVEAGSRAERYKQNTEIMKIVQAAAPNLVTKLLPEFLKDADAPLAERVAKAIEEVEAAGQSEQARMQMQLQMKQLELQMGEIQSKIQLNQAKAAEAAMSAASAQKGMNGEPNGELEA